MKITGFCPMIVTRESDAAISLFEDLGFEKRHLKEGINGKNVSDIRMKDANGFHVDVVHSDTIPKDMMIIKMNVDDFDEAFEFLAARGFKNAQGDKITETGSSRATLMVSPSGFGINLLQHIK